MSGKKQNRKIEIRLDDKTYETLKSLSVQKGLSVSSLVREALAEHLALSEVKNLFKKVNEAMEDVKTITRSLEEYRIPELTAEFKEVNFQLKSLKEEIQRFEKLFEVNLFWGALIAELIKARLFNTQVLGDKEYEAYKKLWEAAHEKADERVESLVGKKVWNRRFNPEK